MTRRHVALVVLLLPAVGCAAAPARHDWAADTASINAMYREGPAGLAAGSVDRYLALLDDSILLIGTGVPAHRGKTAIAQTLTGMYAAATYRVELSPLQLVIADSLATVQYGGVFVTHPKAGGDSTVTRNQYVDVLRRQPDGSWRMLFHTFHAEAPPAP